MTDNNYWAPQEPSTLGWISSQEINTPPGWIFLRNPTFLWGFAEEPNTKAAVGFLEEEPNKKTHEANRTIEQDSATGKSHTILP